MRRGTIERQVGHIEADPCELSVTKRGRFNLPVCFRRGDAYHFVSLGNCLVVYPERYYDEQACDYIKNLLPTDEKRITHFSGVRKLLDDYGRLLIPRNLIKKHNISIPGLIEIIASGDCFLIQPRQKFH